MRLTISDSTMMKWQVKEFIGIGLDTNITTKQTSGKSLIKRKEAKYLTKTILKPMSSLIFYGNLSFVNQ